METTFQKIIKELFTLRDESQGQLDYPLAEAFSKKLTEYQLSDDQQLAQWHLLATDMENDYNAQAKDISFLNWDKSTEDSGAQVTLKEGYGRIVHHLSEGLDIRFNEPVTEIDYRKEKVIVTTKSQKHFVADHVIVTVPLGVLKKKVIKFKPSLPQFKLDAIDRTGFGNFHKTYLVFPTQFWTKRDAWLEFVNQPTNRWPIFFNLAKYASKPVLVGFHIGAFADEQERKTDAEIQEDVMQLLRNAYGKSIPNPLQIVTTHWRHDPFAYGAYSFPAFGAKSDDLDAIAQSIDQKIFFAGEATSSRVNGTTHAAFLSGQRVAEEIKTLSRVDLP